MATLKELESYNDRLKNLSWQQLENVQKKITSNYGWLDNFKQTFDTWLNKLSWEEYEIGKSIADNLYGKLDMWDTTQSVWWEVIKWQDNWNWNKEDTGKELDITPANGEGDPWDRTDPFEDKKAMYEEMTGRLRDTFDSYYQEGMDRAWDLSDKLMGINESVANNIKEQEQIVENKFNEMQANLDTIAENQRKVSAAQQAGAKAAAERWLRWQLGWAAEAQIANYVQKSNQDAAQAQARLESELAQQANTLQQNYLTAKNNIMQSENINENQKAEYLQAIDNKVSQLESMKNKANADLIEMEYTPEKEEIALKDALSQTALKSRLDNRLNTFKLRWAETDPLWRANELKSIIANAGSAWISIPENIYNSAVNAPTATEATKILSNYVGSMWGTEDRGTGGYVDPRRTSDTTWTEWWQTITPDSKPTPDNINTMVEAANKDWVYPTEEQINKANNANTLSEAARILEQWARTESTWDTNNESNSTKESDDNKLPDWLFNTVNSMLKS